MRRLEDWAFTDNIRGLLAGLLNEGQLTLVLGAGVGFEIGLPRWSVLLDHLETKCSIVHDPGDADATPLKRADAVRAAFNDDGELKRATHDLLYEEFDFAKIASNPLLLAIGAVLSAASRSNAAIVITLNYDDVLEQFLEVYGNVVEVDHDARGRVTPGGVISTWHPHGFLPHTTLDRSSASIVLDTDSYARIEAHPLWQAQLVTLMRRSFCLFVGLSGDDPHLERHLRMGSEENTSLGQLPRWGIWLTTVAEAGKKAKFLNDCAVHPLPFSSFDAYPDFLLGICQTAAELRSRRSAASSAPLQRRDRNAKK